MVVLDGADDDRKHKPGGDSVDHSRQQHTPAGPLAEKSDVSLSFEDSGRRNGQCNPFEHLQNSVASDAFSKYYYYDASGSESGWRSASSSSSTRQMLGGDHHRSSSNSNGSSSPRHQGQQPSSSTSRRRGVISTVPFAKKIDWVSLWGKSKAWIRNPMNMALSAWILAVAVAGAILFMVMTGMLNRALPRKSQRDTWFEASNQVLNALFTLMCLVQHPRRCHHLFLLCRWRAGGDVRQLRQAYCKDGACKPDERKHMMVVVLLLHLNCFAQYALCGLNLGYRRPQRPVIGVALTVSVAIAAPAAAGLYNNLSPLGRDYVVQPEMADEESPSPQLQRKTPERRYSLVPRRQLGGGGRSAAGNPPEWAGGVVEDAWEDMSLAYLTVCCSCCVLGWNMGRLGLGNAYVHVATFLLLCLAPFFVLDLAAVSVDDEAVRDALGLAGVLLCVLGLLYGGFWRIQMRRRFGFPENRACCGRPDLTDCMLWLCCYSCALAQEVRTADAYEVVVVVEQDNQPMPMQLQDNQRMPMPMPAMQRQPTTTLREELARMQEPFRFATPAAAAAARSVVEQGVTMPSSSVSAART